MKCIERESNIERPIEIESNKYVTNKLITKRGGVIIFMYMNALQCNEEPVGNSFQVIKIVKVLRLNRGHNIIRSS